jgi:CRP-like cAMP-binding protein
MFCLQRVKKTMGAFLFKEGYKVHGLYIVLSGTLKVSRKRQLFKSKSVLGFNYTDLGMMGRGSVLGEEDCSQVTLDLPNYTTTVQCVS